MWWIGSERAASAALRGPNSPGAAKSTTSKATIGEERPGSASWIQLRFSPNKELGQVMLESVACGSAARGHAELTVDRGQVPVDGARANDELLSNLGIGDPLGYQA
jgi:hypothetical protein